MRLTHYPFQGSMTYGLNGDRLRVHICHSHTHMNPVTPVGVALLGGQTSRTDRDRLDIPKPNNLLLQEPREGGWAKKYIKEQWTRQAQVWSPHSGTGHDCIFTSSQTKFWASLLDERFLLFYNSIFSAVSKPFELLSSTTPLNGSRIQIHSNFLFQFRSTYCM